MKVIGARNSRAEGFPHPSRSRGGESSGSTAKKHLIVGLAASALVTFGPTSAPASVITYDVNLTFDPNATPESTLGAAGPGTVTGTVTINTALDNSVTGNLVAVDLLEKSNNGTILSVFSQSAAQAFTTITPYQIIFLGGPVTEYPASQTIYDRYTAAQPYEFVSFSSPPIIDSIQEGPSIQFDFPYLAGGAVLPGNFDSIASTGFNAYLYGTVTPATAPEPLTWVLWTVGVGLLGGTLRVGRRRALSLAANPSDGPAVVA